MGYFEIGVLEMGFENLELRCEDLYVLGLAENVQFGENLKVFR